MQLSPTFVCDHGRAFRIGQSRDVKVFRLITEGTVEEMMYLRQVYKQVCVHKLVIRTTFLVCICILFTKCMREYTYCMILCTCMLCSNQEYVNTTLSPISSCALCVASSLSHSQFFSMFHAACNIEKLGAA